MGSEALPRGRPPGPPRPSRLPRPPRLTGVRAAVVVLLSAGSLLAALPFLYMASTSLKSIAETLTRASPFPFSPDFWPRVPRWSNYVQAWTLANFSLYVRNSLLTAAVTAAAVCVTSCLSAYALPGSASRDRASCFRCFSPR